ncbi:MAG: nuclear transport factor 2 family protein [Planctomyces sp.]|nr:nuclear transport factor 2 family protein [Planctomyces sp.]
MVRLCLPVVIGWLLTSACALGAEASPDDLQAAIRKSAEQFEKSYAARDIKTLAGLFTPEAEYVDATGVVFHGREAISNEFAAVFSATPPGTLSIDVFSIRPIAAGVVVEDGLTVFRPQAEGPATLQRYTATHVRQTDGTWLLASVRELAAPVVSPHDRLQPALGWLTGHWRQESHGSVVDTNWAWSNDGSFLIGEFSARQPTGEALAGTHRIGWDAERGQFRSWVFSSDGGSADGWWSAADDGAWSLRLNGVDSDGSRQAATVTYQRDGGDALVITQSERVVDGESLPGFSNRVVRQPPAPVREAAAR